MRSTLIGQNEEVPFGVAYELNIELGWIVSTAIFQRDGRQASSILHHDGKGNWAGRPAVSELRHLAGCIDIDISRTPFTNTLPMRRVAFEPNVPQRFDMAWVPLDTMTSVVTARSTPGSAATSGATRPPTARSRRS